VSTNVYIIRRSNQSKLKNKLKKKVILITNPDKVALLNEMGIFSCGTRDFGDGNVAYQFVMSDRLHKALKDKNLFSRKDYGEDIKLTF
jgi:hypothetical protein